MASFGHKCIIMRSKGLGSLSIKFGGHLSKFEEWPNSSNFDKLTVDSAPKKVVFGCAENSTKSDILILDQKTHLRIFSKMLLGP